MLMNKIGIIDTEGSLLRLLEKEGLPAESYRADTDYDYVLFNGQADWLGETIRAKQVIYYAPVIRRSRMRHLPYALVGKQGDYYAEHVMMNDQQICFDFFAHHTLVGHFVFDDRQFTVLEYLTLLAYRYLEGFDFS